MSADGMEIYTAPAGFPPPPNLDLSGWQPIGTIAPGGIRFEPEPNTEPVHGWGVPAPVPCDLCAREATHRAGETPLCAKCVAILAADQPRRERRASGYHGPRAVPIGGDR